MRQRPLRRLDLTNASPGDTGKFRDKVAGETATKLLEKELYDLLYLMFAEGKHSLLIILHGIDASGKDGTVRHIFGAANPQGMRVHSFKQPTPEELRHDYLWRCHRAVPEAGFAAIFNRSYYEEVTTVRVHPEYLKAQHLPDKISRDPDLFEKRYRQINEFEQMLALNGVIVVKFLLNISKGEQKARLKERLEDRTKNWKFSPQDLKERKHWDKYMQSFQQMLNRTHSKDAPWHITPADKKWYRNYQVTKVLVERLRKLEMQFPRV